MSKPVALIDRLDASFALEIAYETSLVFTHSRQMEPTVFVCGFIPNSFRPPSSYRFSFDALMRGFPTRWVSQPFLFAPPGLVEKVPGTVHVLSPAGQGIALHIESEF